VDANCVLKIYYEISQADQLFISRRAAKVTGKGDPFKHITRSEMIAKTSIQSMAHAFDFDKIQSKREDVALYQILRQEPLVANNPQSVWTLLRNITKNWSQKWKNQIDTLLPQLEQLKAQQLQLAVQAVAQYVKMKAEEAEVTGVKPEIDPKELLGVILQMQSEMATNPPEEVLKEREKNAKA